MRRQSLENVCSISHAHGIGHPRDRAAVNEAEDAAAVKAWRQELFDKSKEEPKHQLLVVGPNQRIAKMALRKMKKARPKSVKLAVSLNTGHGGNTEIWLVLREFRGIDASAAFVPDAK